MLPPKLTLSPSWPVNSFAILLSCPSTTLNGPSTLLRGSFAMYLLASSTDLNRSHYIARLVYNECAWIIIQPHPTFLRDVCAFFLAVAGVTKLFWPDSFLIWHGRKPIVFWLVDSQKSIAIQQDKCATLPVITICICRILCGACIAVLKVCIHVPNIRALTIPPPHHALRNHRRLRIGDRDAVEVIVKRVFNSGLEY